VLLLTAEPISYFQAIVLGLLQGFSELFPISSLGHSVILPQLLGWNIHQNNDYFITFLIATHLATAIVLFIFFFHDWMRIFAGMRVAAAAGLAFSLGAGAIAAMRAFRALAADWCADALILGHLCLLLFRMCRGPTR
jgi:undecaprenyl pyrophosphate phosphatase UppP